MSIGTIYLLAGALLLFGACVFAARKAIPDLRAKQFAIIAVISISMVSLIWFLLAAANKKREESPIAQPPTQAALPLQPNPD